MKVYLAAKFGEKQRMQVVRDYLVKAGHVVTSTWLDSTNETDAEGIKSGIMELTALKNMGDVYAADVFVTFSHPQGTSHTGGGRHWEFGYAYAKGKPVIIVGPKGEHVFHFLPGVVHIEESQLIEALQSKTWAGVLDLAMATKQ